MFYILFVNTIAFVERPRCSLSEGLNEGISEGVIFRRCYKQNEGETVELRKSRPEVKLVQSEKVVEKVTEKVVEKLY